MAGQQGNSTKQLDQVLGFWDLMGSAVGQIIGAGIMSLMPAAIAMTGRSVPISFLIAAFITCANAIPYIFICSCVRLRGGAYTQIALLAGKTFAGMQVITKIIGNMSLAMYGLSLASYLCALFGWAASLEKWVGLAILTVFFILNLIGLDIFAKVQNSMVVILICSLIMFGVAGIGKVNWDTYFVDDGYLMMNGILGMCQAAGLLTFATGGATVIVSFSAEAKNPTRDIPLVIIISTLFVAVLYGVLSFVAAGVLPVSVVGGENLTMVAKTILSKPLYVIFIIGGAGGALASTLNNQMATSPKPIMQMCDDGWLPQSFAALNKKKVPWKIQTMFYLVGVICCVSGLSISILGNMSLILSGITGVIVAISTSRIPKLLPEAWAKSKFHVSDGVLKMFCGIALVASLFSTYMNASSIDIKLVILNGVFLVIAIIFGVVKGKSVHMDISYEEA